MHQLKRRAGQGHFSLGEGHVGETDPLGQGHHIGIVVWNAATLHLGNHLRVLIILEVDALTNFIVCSASTGGGIETSCEASFGCSMEVFSHFSMFRLFLTTLTFTTLLAVPLSSSAVSGKWFDRIVVVNLENKDPKDALGQSYLATLKKTGLYLSNYYAITHPSQPNYIAQIYGETGTSSNDNVDLTNKSLVELLEGKHVSWKSYQENLPSGSCVKSASSSDGLYRRKHNPFISMRSVSGNATLCAKNVHAKQLDVDISNDSVPQVVYYTPNMDNNGHDTNVGYASEWLESFLKPRLGKPAFSTRTLFFITFDEDDSSWGSGSSLVYAVLYGDVVKDQAGTINSDRYSHYSLLKTIEDNWDLGTLNRNDKTARTFPLMK
jgi:hypothetical protein